MAGFIDYLSGNVPGGIFLYLLVNLVVFFILLFMLRVNELFSRKHFFRWLILSVVLLTVVYLVIWFKNPPPQIYKRYSVAIFQSNTKANWLGKYFTSLISEDVRPFKDKREFFVPAEWFYRITPGDSVENPHFLARFYAGIPVRRVLGGKINRTGSGFSAELYLKVYPSQKIVKTAHRDFRWSRLGDFRTWVGETFGEFFPFQTAEAEPAIVPPDSLLAIAKTYFFARKYQKCDSLLQRISKASPANPEVDKWVQYVGIKLAGAARLQAPKENPYSRKVPDWKRRLQRCRDRLLEYARQDHRTLRLNLIIAESYIWEENYEAAEVFLKQAYLENPFHVDVLLNFSFLHPSRFQEFGFRNAGAIYRRILEIFPLDEEILIKWSQYILVNNPAYTAPPEFAKKYLVRYLDLNPYSSRIWAMLGEIYSQQRRREQAERAFFKADSLDPDNGLIQYDLGVLYYDWGRYQKAKEYFRRSIRLEDYLDSHLYLGAIYKKEGNYQAALQEFRYRVAHKKGDDDVYAFQAMRGIRECLETLGETPE